jgi:osmoprotectant transport system ATP-binding protein
MRGGQLVAQGTAADLAATDDAYVDELLQTPRRQAERLQALLPRGSAT